MISPLQCLGYFDHVVLGAVQEVMSLNILVPLLGLSIFTLSRILPNDQGGSGFAHCHCQ